MNRTALAASTFCLLVFSSFQTHAAILQYTGLAFTNTGVGAGEVTAIVDFNTALTNGAVLGASDVNSFSITALGDTSTDTTAAWTAMEFVIGPSGLPTAWLLAVEEEFQGDSDPETILTSSGTTSFWGLTFDVYGVSDSNTGDQNFNLPIGGTSFVSGSPGTWAVVPEPASMGLWVIGFAVFIGIAKRRARGVTSSK